MCAIAGSGWIRVKGGFCLAKEYDAIVVGARCAGSPTAMLLARKGYDVLLVDRASFPSDTISTHIIWPAGASRLKRWGLLDRVVATGCPRIDQPLTMDFGPAVLQGRPAGYDGVREAYSPRRTVLDKILIDAAAEAGAEMRERFTVDEVASEAGIVTGIRGHSQGGDAVTETAKIVIGADGLHSAVAKAAQAPSYNEKPPLACYYYSYWSGVPVEGGQLYVRPDCGFGALPTNDGRTLVMGFWPSREFPRVRENIEESLFQVWALHPEFEERVRGGKREERIVGTGDIPNFFRKPYGPGWALVGDAGYHKDPVTAQGISDAFRDAEALAEAVDAGFTGRQPLDAGLAEYERRRNEQVTPLYEFTCQFASLEPPPEELQQLIGALQGNQEQTDRFLGVTAGSIPVPEFFAPQNIEKILSGA